jgi:PAS domain S-box-containing protein
MAASGGARRAAHDEEGIGRAAPAADRDFGAALVDTAQTLVCVLDRDGRIVRFNRACEAVTGFRSEEVVGRDARETVIPPEEADDFGRVLDEVAMTHAPSPQQGHWVTKRGGRRVIAWANKPLFDEDGDVRYIVTSGLDITDRDSAASELWTLQAELQERVAELARLADEQAALRRVATLVAREPAPEAVFQAVTKEASRLLGAQSGAMLCYDEDASVGTIVGRWDEAGRQGFPVGTRLPIEGDSLSVTVRASGRAGRIDDYSAVSGEIARRMRDQGFRSVVAAPVVVAGRVWGLLVASTHRPEPLPEGAEERLESFAELVGLALASTEARNELAASRARIVEAADDARRRLERDLHDGAQQRLVAVSLSMRLARARLEKDPESAGKLLDQAAEQLSQGLEQLRELARGIHPAVLTDRGLLPSLESLASRTPFPVELDVVDERFAHPVEVAVHYLVSEALTNAAKYANPTVVRVTVAREGDDLLAAISDDGRGGADPAAGTGLRGLADRVEALGGRLRVDSPPGKGTTVRARLPLR